MGSVYRAIDENLGVEVAVKENFFTTDEYARQFRLEAVILRYVIGLVGVLVFHIGLKMFFGHADRVLRMARPELMNRVLRTE
jgi:hypothetical protein